MPHFIHAGTMLPAVVFFATNAKRFHRSTIVLGCAAMLVAGYAPDLDLLWGAACDALHVTLPQPLKHRGISHSFLAVPFWAALIWWTFRRFSVRIDPTILVLAVASHATLDIVESPVPSALSEPKRFIVSVVCPSCAYRSFTRQSPRESITYAVTSARRLAWRELKNPWYQVFLGTCLLLGFSLRRNGIRLVSEIPRLRLVPKADKRSSSQVPAAQTLAE